MTATVRQTPFLAPLFAAWEPIGKTALARELAGHIESSAARGFEPARFPSADPRVARLIGALAGAGREFPELPPAVWEALAYVAANHGEEERSFLEAEDLPMDPDFMDACIHAFGLTFGLQFHVNARLSAASGLIVLHGCGCGCHVQPGSVAYAMREGEKPAAVRAFYAHLFGQYHLLKENMPFMFLFR